MGEILPDGSVQSGYGANCRKCGKEIVVNVQGDEMGDGHDCPFAHVKPDSLWLVVVECRLNVIAVSPKGDGFFIPGQEPCWALREVQQWIREIKEEEVKPFPKGDGMGGWKLDYNHILAIHNMLNDYYTGAPSMEDIESIILALEKLGYVTTDPNQRSIDAKLFEWLMKHVSCTRKEILRRMTQDERECLGEPKPDDKRLAWLYKYLRMTPEEVDKQMQTEGDDPVPLFDRMCGNCKNLSNNMCVFDGEYKDDEETCHRWKFNQTTDQPVEKKPYPPCSICGQPIEYQPSDKDHTRVVCYQCWNNLITPKKG